MVCYIAIQYYNIVFNHPCSYFQLPIPVLVLDVPVESQRLISCYQQKQELEGKINRITKEQQNGDKRTKTPPPMPLISKNTTKSKRQEIAIIQKLPIQKRNKEVDSFTERRNIIPNNINHILAFIQRKSKSEHLVDRVIQKQGKEGLTSKRFYCYQTYLKQKLHIHVNKFTLHMISNHLELSEEIFSVDQQLSYNRITRIMISYYIRQLAKLKILSSGRVICTNKLDHLKAHRILEHYLLGNYEQA